MKYYEVISNETSKVVAVCSAKGLVTMAREEGLPIFGEISLAQFKKYITEEPWTEPQSAKRFSSQLKVSVSLTEVSS